MKKRIIIPTLALSTLLAIGLTANTIKADDSDTGRTSIIQMLSEKFNVPEDEVEAVFDAHRDERHESMLVEKEEWLSDAVANGKITEEQKQALIAKMEEMRSQKGDLRNLEPAARREVMVAHKEEFQSWTEENGIDMEELKEGFGMEHKGFGGGFKRGLHHMN